MASGPMPRSTDEWLMSRSCHRATFSIAGVTAERTRRARPVRFSVRTGLRFVRHRRRALLALVEEFLGFEDFGALQMADFDGQALDRRCDDAQGGEEGGVAVARDHLGRDRLDLQAHLFGHIGFDGRIDVGEGADGAGDGAGGDLFLGGDQASFGALELGVIAGQLQAEGDGLGVDAVRTAHGRGVFVLLGAGLQRGQNPIHALDQQVRRPGQLNRETGVQHVRRGHALVQEAGFLADDFRHVGQEGDDVGVWWCVSISSIRSASKVAFSPLAQMASAASLGITPSSAILVAAWASISNQILYLVSVRPEGGGDGAGIARDHGRVVSVAGGAESRFRRAATLTLADPVPD